MSEKLTEEELMEVIGGAIRRDKAYWARGRSDSENARWSQNINKLEQAYNQLKEIIKTYFFAEVPKQKEGQIKPTVSREWLLKWREKNSAARFCWLYEDVIYLLKELGWEITDK